MAQARMSSGGAGIDMGLTPGCFRGLVAMCCCSASMGLRGELVLGTCKGTEIGGRLVARRGRGGVRGVELRQDFLADFFEHLAGVSLGVLKVEADVVDP